MTAMASYVRSLDPRLKLAIALVLGPCLWKIGIISVSLYAIVFFLILIPLAKSQPLGGKMVRGLLVFVLFWVALKIGIDGVTGMPLGQVALDALELGLRLTALLLLGLSLAMSTSARSLGLAVSWAIRPLVGKEHAWRLALSLALMIHFLPMCLSTMTSVKETVARRCPEYGFRQRMLIIPQAAMRNLGQKTWSQTLAVAGRGLEDPQAWEPEFTWSGRDWVCTAFASFLIPLTFII